MPHVHPILWIPGPPSELALWVAALLSYLVGAIPFGFLFARLKGIDLRSVGSGNIGATNTMRALGRGWGLTAFALDFAKGWVAAAWIASLVVPVPPDRLAHVVCGTFAVFGHCFPVYLGFRGGKGVATGCGAIVALDPLVFVAGGLVWLAVLGASRFVSLASIGMGIAFPIAAWWRHPSEPPFWAGAILLMLLILVRHRANIRRLIAGTELRTGDKSKGQAEVSDG